MKNKRVRPSIGMNQKVFVISDTHFPFHNKKAYAKMLKLIKDEQPDVVIQIGDLLDQYVFSKYTKRVKITPHDDVVLGLQVARQMWADIQKTVKNVKCYQILGNHDVRLMKRIGECLPELAEIYNLETLYNFPGVKVMKSDREHLELDGIIYCHGHLNKSIDHAKHFNKPTVHGHRHRPIIETEGSLWSMDVGFLADIDSIPLSYTPSTISKWRLAVGIVQNNMPRLILL
jgi:predicted phosphodiesterase